MDEHASGKPGAALFSEVNTTLLVIIGIVLACAVLWSVYLAAVEHKWLLAGLVMIVIGEVLLAVVLIAHSLRVGYFDFDWADAHLMGWVGLFIIPLPACIIVEMLSESSPKPTSLAA